MKDHVYNGPGKIEWKKILTLKILKPTDAIVKIVKTTIYGIDRAFYMAKHRV